MQEELRRKIEKSIRRLQTFEPDDGYYVAFSGGKDSCVIKKLADISEVKYDAHYNVTSADPPELVRFIQEKYPDVIFDYPRDKDGNRITMWNLIPKKKMPPTRTARYCCKVLKEHQGENRFNVTGVRWEESYARKKRGGLEVNFCKTTQNEIYDVDNNEKRLVRLCRQNIRRILNPIIDWTYEDVWAFIRDYEIPYCELYDQGFKRLGCIGCPMAGKKRQKEEFERWPTYKSAYLTAFRKMIENNTKSRWESAEEVMNWWLGEKT